jgi:hypothetical protein
MKTKARPLLVDVEVARKFKKNRLGGLVLRFTHTEYLVH